MKQHRRLLVAALTIVDLMAACLVIAAAQWLVVGIISPSHAILGIVAGCVAAAATSTGLISLSYAAARAKRR